MVGARILDHYFSKSTLIEEYRNFVKQQTAASVAATSSKDQKPGENVGIIMRDKGKAFFSKGNIESAVNAFSTALQTDPMDILALSYRAACHLKLDRYDDCIADCSAALQYLDESVQQASEKQPELKMDAKTTLSMKKLLVRRGFALHQRGQLSEGML